MPTIFVNSRSYSFSMKKISRMASVGQNLCLSSCKFCDSNVFGPFLYCRKYEFRKPFYIYLYMKITDATGVAPHTVASCFLFFTFNQLETSLQKKNYHYLASRY